MTVPQQPLPSFWLEALGAEVREFAAGDINTRAIVAGEGEAVILMHGLTGHAESFIRNVVPLSRRGFRVFSIDLVGHGLSDKPTEIEYGTGAFTGHLDAILDAFGIDRVHLAGQSLGGWVAWRYALDHPDRVASLTSLTGAGFLLDSDEHRRTSEKVHKQVNTVTQAALDHPTKDRVRERLEWLFLEPATVTDELLETRWTVYNRDDSRAVMAKMTSEFTGEKNRATLITESELRQVDCPALVVWTDHNPTLPASIGRRAADVMPNARFELIEDAGHWPQFEKPETVNKLVGDFLVEVRDRATTQ